MNKLTTERLEKLQDDLLQFQDSYSDPADKENYDIFVDALHMLDEFKAAKEQLLAYEQADKTTDLKTLVISEIVDFYSGFESPGEPETVDEAQRQLIGRIEKVFGLAAPVLPKQPEHHATKLDLATIKLWNWNAKITMGETEENCEEWIAARAILSLSDDLLALLAQPVIPEQPHRISDDDLVAVPRSVLACAGYAYGKAGLKGGFAYEELRTYFFAPTITAQPVSEPYKLEIDMDDADHFSITHLHEIIYGKELIWPEAKLLARFMLDVKQRVSAAPAQESE